MELSFYASVAQTHIGWCLWPGQEILESNIYEDCSIGKFAEDGNNGQPWASARETERRLGRIDIYHQPGVGETTVAKHVLWKFSSKYRCAVISKISDQTCEQIFLKLLNCSDSAPKSVLLLLVNYVDEQISDPTRKLIEKYIEIGTWNKSIKHCFYRTSGMY